MDDSCDEYSEEEDEKEEEDEEEEEEEEKKEMTDGERLVAYLNTMKRNEIRQQAYSGFKFQHYMTSEEPEVITVIYSNASESWNAL